MPERHPRGAPEGSAGERRLILGRGELAERARRDDGGPSAEEARRGDLDDRRERGSVFEVLLGELERVPVCFVGFGFFWK